MFRATLLDASYDRKYHVLVRVFGEGTEKLVDREKEILVRLKDHAQRSTKFL